VKKYQGVFANFTAEPVTVGRGERTAQALVLPAPTVEIVEAAASGESRDGFGSTG
jgi:dUTPase